MGGLIRAPKPAIIAAPQPEATPTPAPPPEAAGQAARAETRAQAAARGLAGTIATSARGVLSPLPGGLARKSLLGE